MGTTRLRIYNGALLHCKQRALATLTENQESRRLLDQVWNDGGVRACLEQGQWRFGRRSQKLIYSTEVSPQYGYRRAFVKPDDWCVTAAVCQDEYYKVPLLRYQDEVGFIFADYDEIFVTYVSDDANFGGNLSGWPANFINYVQAYFAGRIAGKLTNDDALDLVLNGPPGRPGAGRVEALKLQAKNSDAQSDPTKFPARGSWVNARTSGYRQDRDGGNPTTLIGG